MQLPNQNDTRSPQNSKLMEIRDLMVDQIVSPGFDIVECDSGQISGLAFQAWSRVTGTA